MNTANPSRTYLTIPCFSKKHEPFTQGAIRALIWKSRPRFNKTSGEVTPGNGMDVAILRVGRRLYIDEQRFFEWLSSHSVALASPHPLSNGTLE
jgi:hypothetical protein